MAWCEENGVDYIFGLPGAKPLARKADEAADAIRTGRALSGKPVVRGYAETLHRAKSWNRERRAVARIEATALGLDIRFVVTNIAHSPAEWIYDSLYCARGQMENLSSGAKRNWPRIEHLAVPPSPTRSALCCTPPPIGSCSPSATP